MPEWAYKPDAEIHAEVVTTEAELDEIFQFCLDNPIPRWQMHPNMPPFPSRSQLTFYLERGNDIYVTRDEDGEMWAFTVRSRKDYKVIWIYARREARPTHEVLPDGTEGLTRNARLSIAHMHALAWARHGVFDLDAPVENENAIKITEFDQSTGHEMGIPALTESIYNSGQYQDA